VGIGDIITLPKPQMNSFHRSVKSMYWSVVKKFNRLAYLRHIVDSSLGSDDLDWEYYEEMLTIETRIWINRGTKVHLAISDVPHKEGDHPWKEGSYGRFVEWDTLRKFKKVVEDGEYERNRRRREWITAIGVIVAALGALANLYFTLWGKKP
jgi:hypothetical protein